MKYHPKKLLSLLLAGLMLCSVTACGTGGDDPPETKDPSATEALTEEDTGYKPDIGIKDYDCEFVITGVDPMVNWTVTDESTAGDPFMDAIYERGIRVREHLGVELVLIPARGGNGYSEDVVRTVQSGDDVYQLVATACHSGVTYLLTSGAMYDFAELESINMDAPYWSKGIMEEYLINDQYIVGYNEICLANAACMVFNKDLADKYRLTAPYDDVRNMVWTMDKMMTFISDVAGDNGDGVWDVNDTYGITGNGLTDLISLTISNGIKMVDRNEDGDHHIAYGDNSEKMLAYLKKLEEIDRAEYSYFGKPLTETDGMEASFNDGRALLRMQNTGELMTMRATQVRFGVLPYPMYDEAQGEYLSLNWNGLLMIPGVIKDPMMVGDTLEMLAYYTAPVKTAFYEDLLGSKLAEAPDDAEMLNVIWETQTSDVCLVVSSGGAELWDFLYMVPFLCRDGVDQYASYMKSRVKAADKALDKMFNPRVRT